MNKMDLMAAIIVSIAAYSWMRTRRKNKNPSIARLAAEIAIVLLISSSVSFILSIGTRYLRNDFNTAHNGNSALKHINRVPVLRAVLENEPEVKERFIRLTYNHENLDDAKLLHGIILEIRNNFVIPSLLSADDSYIIEAWNSRERVINLLAADNIYSCAQFTINGNFDERLATQDAIRTFNEYLIDIERAYLNGRGKKQKKVVDDNTLGDIMIYNLGFTRFDIDKLIDSSSASSSDICRIGVQILTRIDVIPDEYKIPFARRVLTMTE